VAEPFSLNHVLIVQRPAGSGRRLIGVERLARALQSAGATVDIVDGHGGAQLEALALREGWRVTATTAGPAAADAAAAGPGPGPGASADAGGTATAGVDDDSVTSLLHYEQQFSLFSRARFVVAAHGAALANLIFCDPQSCRAVEIMPEQVRHACMGRPIVCAVMRTSAANPPFHPATNQLSPLTTTTAYPLYFHLPFACCSSLRTSLGGGTRLCQSW